MDFIGSDLFILFDLASIGFGVFLLINPNKAYKLGSKDSENREVPKNWHIAGRVIGAVLVAVGAVFLLVRFT